MPLAPVRLALAGAVAALALVSVQTPAHAAPNNDDFQSFAPFPSGGAVYAGTNVGATAQPGEPAHAGMEAYHSVWWTWTPEVDGPVTISTCDSDFNTRLAVYTGSALGDLDQVAANDDSAGPVCAGSLFAEVVFDAVAGTEYHLVVDTSGGYPDNSPGNPYQGDVRIEVAPGGQTPGGITEPAVKVRIPDFTPKCAQSGTTPAKCDERRLKFKLMRHVRSWVAARQAEGGDVTLVENAKPSVGQDGSVTDYLRGSRARGGEILQQNVKPGTAFFTTVEKPVLLKVGYFEPAEDEKIRKAILAALEKAGDDNKNVKSPCEFIDSNATPDQIEARMASLLTSAYLTQKRAGEILKGFGCGYEVSRYIEAPGAPVDFVKNVTGIDRKRHLIELEVALPVRQDFLLILREDPSTVDAGTLSLGADGKLTVSRTQLTLMTVQVVERLTGKLVKGVEVSFVGPDGKPETKVTDGKGEVWFASGLLRPDRHAIVARVAGQGGSIVGYRSIDVVERNGASFVTMSGREMVKNASGYYISSQADLERSKSLPVVPANLGTGLSGAPTSAPTIVQSAVAHPDGQGGWVVGEGNIVNIVDDTNFAVGAAPGLVTLGGGLPNQVGRAENAARMWPNPFQPIADSVNYICTGLTRAFDQAAGTVKAVVTAAQEQAVRTTAQNLAAGGAATPSSNLISDKGLGIISDNGGGIISTDGASVISVGGLNLRDAQGNLIGQAGGNIISTDGAGIISTDGASVLSLSTVGAMPVDGGNLIGQAGGN